MRIIVAAICGATLLVTAACSGGESGAQGAGASGGSGGGGGMSGTGGGSAGALSLEDFADAYAQTFCGGIASCCVAAGHAYDAEQCRAGWSALIGQALVTPAQTFAVAYDGQAAATCLAAYGEALRTCGTQGVGEAETACAGAFAGTKAEGVECAHDLECQEPAGGRADCEADDAGVQRCSPEPRGVAGTPCEKTCTQTSVLTRCSGLGPGTARCYTNDGLFCDETGTGTCRTLLEAGEPCSESDNCVATTYCAAGLCAARKGNGNTCVTTDECLESAYCSGGSCIARKPPGSACDLSSECLDGACRANVCESSDFPTAGQCRGELM